MNKFFCGIHRKRNQSGIALIVVLSVVVLTTVVVVALLSRSQNVRLVESSGAAKAQAEVFARSGIEYTLGLLSAEITDSNASSALAAGGRTIFMPKSPHNMVPLKQVKTAVGAQYHVPSIYKQSIRAFDPNASDVAANISNRLGRLVSYEVWTKSRLYFSPLLPSLIPDWIYFDEQGPTHAGNSRMVGRLAFNMFITNNLIDFSVAGFPAALLGNIPKINQLKGSAAGANLRKIGFVVPLLDDPNLVLVDYRNRGSVAMGDYVSRILNDRDGLLEPQDGDTQFIGRIDLQRFYKRLRTEASDVYMRDDPLAYMAPMVRTLEGPVWKPEVETAENRFALTQLRTVGANVVDYFTDGTTRARELEAGMPVAERKFPLSRLKWFESTHAFKPAAIRQYFGLLPGNQPKQWIYDGSRILTLGEVGALQREPNFFEMLKAAIVAGSLGNSLTTGDALYSMGRDANRDLHILRIGACIIDAAGADNLPTVLRLGSSWVCGVKDLPYLQDVRFIQIATQNAGGAVQRVDQFALPILCNPHATALVGGVSKPPIRLRMVGDITAADAEFGAVKQSLLPRYTGVSSEPGKRAFVISPDGFRTPHPAYMDTRGVTPPSSPAETDINLPELPPHFPLNEAKRLYAFWLSETDPANPPPAASVSGTQLAKTQLDGFNVVLEYWNGSGWAIYDSLLADGTGVLMEEVTLGTQSLVAPDSTGFQSAQAYSMLKPDPRTNRFGIARGTTATLPFYLDNISRNLVDNYPSEATQSYGLPLETMAGVLQGIADPDGIRRPNDLEIGSNTNITKQLKYVLADYLNGERVRGGSTIPQNEERSAIRHQPFYTVAELGGVFRDEPWKTLNFATRESGDKALLDYFCINEPSKSGLTAGRLNLNNTNPPDTFDPQIIDTSYLIGGSTALTQAEASTLRSYLVLGTEAKSMISPAELVGIITPASFNGMDATLNGSKQRKEILARALGTAGQTRTWNFYIDLIAQVGTISSKSQMDLAKDFIPQAEHRFWIHVAIDRFTAEVVDLHIEAYQE